MARVPRTKAAVRRCSTKYVLKNFAIFTEKHHGETTVLKSLF